jgi:hypothetical protein
VASRSAPFAGIAFAVLYVAGWLVMKTPDNNLSPSDTAAYYSNHSHRVMTIVAAYLLVASALVLLWFLAEVRGRLVTSRGGDSVLTTTAFSAGAVGAALITVGSFAIAGVPGQMSFGGTHLAPNADVVLFTQSIGFGTILIGGMLSLAVAIFLSSLAARSSGALPTWTVWLGFVAALALLFAVVWIPQVALPIWTIAAGIAMRRAPASPAQAA